MRGTPRPAAAWPRIHATRIVERTSSQLHRCCPPNRRGAEAGVVVRTGVPQHRGRKGCTPLTNPGQRPHKLLGLTKRRVSSATPPFARGWCRIRLSSRSRTFPTQQQGDIDQPGQNRAPSSPCLCGTGLGTISSHLATLQRAGLVLRRVDRTFRRYRVDRAAVQAAIPLLASSVDKWNAAESIPERALATASVGQWITVAVDVSIDRAIAFDDFTDGERYSTWLGVPVSIQDRRWPPPSSSGGPGARTLRSPRPAGADRHALGL